MMSKLWICGDNMRDIKFRAWDEEKKEMYYDYDQNIKCLKIGESIHQFIWGVGHTYKTLMQYTGLKDKNGKEIYEGDILKMTWGNYLNGVIKFNNKYGYYSFNSRTSEYDFIETQSDEYEIIGNIYENQDLLI